MLIIQIALGILLAAALFRYWRQIGALALVLVAVLVAVAVLYVWRWAAVAWVATVALVAVIGGAAIHYKTDGPSFRFVRRPTSPRPSSARHGSRRQ